MVPASYGACWDQMGEGIEIERERERESGGERVTGRTLSTSPSSTYTRKKKEKGGKTVWARSCTKPTPRLGMCGKPDSRKCKHFS